MEYTCGVCRDKVQGDIISLRDHTEQHIVDEIKKKNPQWIEEDGICPKCLDYFQEQLKGKD